MLIAEIDGEFAGMCLLFPELLDLARRAPASMSRISIVDERFRGPASASSCCAPRPRHVRAEGRPLSAPVGRYANNVAAQHFYERIGHRLVRATSASTLTYGEAFEALAAQHETGTEGRA